MVTVREGASLDRETTDIITISVVAYDSPNNPNDRKSTTIPVGHPAYVLYQFTMHMKVLSL